MTAGRYGIWEKDLLKEHKTLIPAQSAFCTKKEERGKEECRAKRVQKKNEDSREEREM